MSTETARLTVREQMILSLERQRWIYSAVKRDVVREQLGMNMARYWVVLNKLIDTPAAEAYDAVLVHRLRRLREARQRARGARVVGF